MSTTSVSLSIDQAFNYAFNVDRKAQQDGLHLNSGFLSAVKKALGEKMGGDWTGGEVLGIPFTVRVHSQSTGIATGSEMPVLAVQSTQEMIQFRLGDVIRPAIVNQAEMRTISNQAGLNEMVSKRYQECMAAAEREFVQHIVAGGIASYENSVAGGSSFSLNGIDRSYGFFEEDAVGSQTRTIGTFSKGAWASVNGSQNQVGDITSSFSTAGNDKTYSVITSVKKRAQQATKLGAIATEAFINNYKRTLLPQERYNDGKAPNAGVRAEMFGDVPFYVEEFMPISTTYGGSASNTNKMSALIIDFNCVFPKWAPAMSIDAAKIPHGRFGRGPMEKVANQQAWASMLRVAHALCISRWNTSAVLLNGETWA